MDVGLGDLVQAVREYCGEFVTRLWIRLLVLASVTGAVNYFLIWFFDIPLYEITQILFNLRTAGEAWGMIKPMLVAVPIIFVLFYLACWLSVKTLNKADIATAKVYAEILQKQISELKDEKKY